MTTSWNSREEQITPAGGFTNSMHVYVRNQDGTPLMPCTPAKARKLLRAGRAEVALRCPFTIQLGWQCEGHVQEVALGIDRGSHVTDISCVGNGESLLAAEIKHRLEEVIRVVQQIPLPIQRLSSVSAGQRRPFSSSAQGLSVT